MKKRFLLAMVFAAALSVVFGGCAEQNKITQTSTIDALLAGVYDGDMTCRELLTHGDFGIGTFDKLDGEMIVHKGKVYQVKADGKVYTPSLNTKTPFASVCSFAPEAEFEIDSANYDGVKSIIDEKIPNQNLFVAIEIKGTFKYMKTRSVPAQKKPYPPLAEVAKTQPIFEMADIEGTIVGFRAPVFVKGVNVTGYHLHFLSDSLTQGGHILAFDLDTGTCKADICNKLLLILPENDLLKDVDLSKDKSAELEKVEMGR